MRLGDYIEHTQFTIDIYSEQMVYLGSLEMRVEDDPGLDPSWLTLKQLRTYI